MSVIASDLCTSSDILESVRGQIAYWPADAWTRDSSTPSVIFVGDGVVQDSIGYQLTEFLSSSATITFNRELIGCLLFV